MLKYLIILSTIGFCMEPPLLIKPQKISHSKRDKHKTQKEIKKAMRSWIKSWSDSDTKLKIIYLKREKNWAWAEAKVSYKNRKNYDKFISALLRFDGKRWVVEYAPCNRIKRAKRPKQDKALKRFLRPPYLAPESLFY